MEVSSLTDERGGKDLSATTPPDVIAERVAREAAETIVSRFSADFYAGPVPHPEILAGIERVSPGAANRIIRMAEIEQGHRHAIAERRLAITERGQRFGLTIGLAGLAVALVLGLWGAPWVAGIIGTIDLVGLVGIFVAGRLLRQSRESKHPHSSERGPTTQTTEA